MEKTNPYYQLSSLEDGTFDKACESEDIKQYEKKRLQRDGDMHSAMTEAKRRSAKSSEMDLMPIFLIVSFFIKTYLLAK
ncbi:MAG: hypothetical protein IKO41_20255 [Lachnospiraceae bacterium]|nr:hypothetical protein [Lachnospiraceae bacterium]MBR6151225.1 hypothetical protein [Lachnospiraceae bacterium]